MAWDFDDDDVMTEVDYGDDFSLPPYMLLNKQKQQELMAKKAEALEQAHVANTAQDKVVDDAMNAEADSDVEQTHTQNAEPVEQERTTRQNIQTWYDEALPSLKAVYQFDNPKDFKLVNDMTMTKNGDFVLHLNTFDVETKSKPYVLELDIPKEKMAGLIDSYETKADRNVYWLQEIQDWHEKITSPDFEREQETTPLKEEPQNNLDGTPADAKPTDKQVIEQENGHEFDHNFNDAPSDNPFNHPANEGNNMNPNTSNNYASHDEDMSNRVYDDQGDFVPWGEYDDGQQLHQGMNNETPQGQTNNTPPQTEPTTLNQEQNPSVDINSLPVNDRIKNTMIHMQRWIDEGYMPPTVRADGSHSYAYVIYNDPNPEHSYKDSIKVASAEMGVWTVPYNMPQYDENNNIVGMKTMDVPFDAQDVTALTQRFYDAQHNQAPLTMWEQSLWEVHQNPTSFVDNLRRVLDEAKKREQAQEQIQEQAQEGTPAPDAIPPSMGGDGVVLDTPPDTTTPETTPPVPTQINDLNELKAIHERGKYGGFERPADLVDFMHEHTNKFYNQRIASADNERDVKNYTDARDVYNASYDYYRDRVEGKFFNADGTPSHEFDDDSMTFYDVLTYRGTPSRTQEQEKQAEPDPKRDDEKNIRDERATSDFARIIAENMAKLLEKTAKEQREIVENLQREAQQQSPEEYQNWLRENQSRLQQAEQLATSVRTLSDRIQLNSDRAEELADVIENTTGEPTQASESTITHTEVSPETEQDVQAVVEGVQNLTGATPEQAESEPTPTAEPAPTPTNSPTPPAPRPFNAEEAQAINEVQTQYQADYEQIREQGNHLSENPNHPRMAIKIHRDATELMSLVATPPSMLSEEKVERMQELADRFENDYATDPNNARDSKWGNSAYKALVKNEDKAHHDVAIITQTAEALKQVKEIQAQHRSPEEALRLDNFQAFAQEVNQRSQQNANHQPNPYLQPRAEPAPPAPQERVSFSERMRSVFGR